MLMDKSEQEWEAESDARSLATAMEINGDSARLKRAQVAAKRMVEEQKEESKNLSKIAGLGPKTSLHRIKNKIPHPVKD